MDFNKQRFANFAKYDLAINRTFYRNLMWLTLTGTLGIMTLGFLGRYAVSSTTAGTYDSEGLLGQCSLFTTSAYVFSFHALMLCIFSGCWAHNLRNKQGRTTELTLPASNIEKFLWHTLLTMGGGLLLCTASLLIADGANALLSLMVYGEPANSLTASAAGFLDGSVFTDLTYAGLQDDDFFAIIYSPRIIEFFHTIGFVITTSLICEMAIFAFGNAVKYKYNIILTYVALQLIGIICSIAFFIFIGIAADTAIEYMEREGGLALYNILRNSLYVIGTLTAALAAALVWATYNLYRKAQITTPLNKT